MTQSETIQNWAIAYIAMWAISPPLFVDDTARVLVLIATGAWLFLELSRRDGVFLRPTFPVLLTISFVAYTAIVEVLISGPGVLLSHIQIWIMLFFLVIFQSRRNNLRSLTPIFWFVLTVLPIWLFITIKAVLYENPHAARIIVRSSSEAEELVQQGVGGYGLVYGVILLLPCLLVLLLNGFKPTRKELPAPWRSLPRSTHLFLLLNLGMGVFLVLTAGYTIAVITMIVVGALTILLKRISTLRVMTTIFFVLLFVLFSVPILEWTLTSVLPYAEGTNFSVKISDMLRSLHVGDVVGSAGNRMERYVRSIRLFIENPVFGTLVVDNVGKHSEFLDTYAQWGFFIGSILVYLVTFLPLQILRADETRFGAGLAMLAAVLMTFGINNGFAVAGLMLYIMFPVGSFMLNGQDRAVGNEISRLSRA